MGIVAIILGTWILAGICAAGLRVLQALPVVVLFILCLPAWPFIVAYRNRKEHPAQAKIIYIGYPFLYALIALVCLLP